MQEVFTLAIGLCLVLHRHVPTLSRASYLLLVCIWSNLECFKCLRYSCFSQKEKWNVFGVVFLRTSMAHYKLKEGFKIC
jgi:hypothetical protein